MIAWRVLNEEFASPLTALSGAGAKLYGNRWNHAGTAIAYCSENLALALLEYLVGTNLDNLPDNLMKVKIFIPDDIYKEIIPIDHKIIDTMTTNHNSSAKDYGTNWVQKKSSLILIVPSVVIPEENNILINPMHLDAAKIEFMEISPVKIDPRILGVNQRSLN